MKQNGDVVVLGAGLTGLSCAYHLDRKTPIYEQETRVGGLVRTNDVGGYKFDLAPHLLHFRSKEIRCLVREDLQVELSQHVRNACIYFDGRLMPYPFELNLSHTHDDVRDDCLRGLEEVSPDVRNDEDRLRSGSFHEYAMQAFGPGISNHYLLPYNRKIWDTDPREMTCEWMRFLPTADLAKIRKNAFEPSPEAFGYNTQFYYPTRGGIQDVPDAFASRLENIQLAHQATSIDTKRRLVTFANGQQTKYGTLISTIPLNTLARLTGLSRPIDLAMRLVNTTVYVVNVVIRGNVPPGVHWLYFPDPEIEFYRISFPCHFFDRAAPVGEHIIAAEIGSRDPFPNVDRLGHIVSRRLQSLDAFSVAEVTGVHVDVIPYAYCIYDKQRTAVVDELQRELRSFNIISTGRYGLWEYSAMEDAIVHGKRLAEELETGKPAI